ncbi:nitrate- and nitrite sensing domain-containing protein [Actinomadura barringtoniae]|uniref:histidine kinase n=1 Tax=Actinomadura barringtoniae TaxID=1427535 RepID=A0A939T647_9ACTN|nr:nitrate- and nitrite sensing domain-containing protein [Actinomadura barringtoniae]MBO2450369.1 nitrate- and nitrite sensing domain-containing protein [Actinomadura barringtoniae]
MFARRLASIRARIIALILVPLLALASLWVFVTGITYGDAKQLIGAHTFQQKSVLPTQRLMEALQKERRLSLWQLGAGRGGDRSALDAQRRVTDSARAAVTRYSRDSGLRGAVLPLVRDRIDTQVARMGALDAVRRLVDDGGAERSRVLDEYAGMIDAGFAVYNAVVPENGTIAIDARTLTTIGRAREYLSREDALLTGALAAGRFGAFERVQFTQLAGAQRTLYSDTSPNLRSADLARYRELVASPQFGQLRALEDKVIRPPDPIPAGGTDGTGGTGGAKTGQGAGAGAPRTEPGAQATALPVDPATWRATADAANGKLFDFENEVLAGVTERANGIALGVFVRLGVAGGLGLIAVIVSAYIAFRNARRLVRECRTLAGRVVHFTQQRLPELAQQVRDGEPTDPLEADDLPEYDYRINEIRQISDSFSRAREAVLVAAAGEVAAREGLSEVFVNLARRNQALVHRQLSLLDTMERRTEEPSELADLFRLDHLATRMRRHAEGLVILAGKSAGRAWRRPVPLVDVVRGAVAEVEDYPRVRVEPLPRKALLGAAVADVIHLVAEIVENATAYSPPNSPVQISGHPVASGFAIEIEDRGLGMSEDALVTANARLADPPEFDPSDSAQLGLFVVARLARRHDIKVTLRPSPYGGTTAIALLPGALIVEPDEPEPIARRSAGTGPMRALPESAEAVAPVQNGVVRLVAEPQDPGPVPALEQAPASPPPPLVRRPRPAAPPPSAPTPEPRPAQPLSPAPVEAPAAEPSPSPARPPQPVADGDLPKRRRQQHLAPQLRERVDADLAAAAEPDELERSPEAMRSMMAAMQRGWQRGREAAGPAGSGQNNADQEDQSP